MDPAIQAVQEKMEMIAGDPALLHAYDMFEMARIDYKMGIQGARQDGKKERAYRMSAEKYALDLQSRVVYDIRQTKAPGDIVSEKWKMEMAAHNDSTLTC
jgi:hypothetical protein